MQNRPFLTEMTIHSLLPQTIIQGTQYLQQIMSVIMVDPLWSTTQSQKSSIPSVPACTGDTNGNIKALVTNPAVRSDALSEIVAGGYYVRYLVTHLRMHNVPLGYTIHRW